MDSVSFNNVVLFYFCEKKMGNVKNLGLDLQKLACKVLSIFIKNSVLILFLYDHIFLLKNYMQHMLCLRSFMDEISQAESRKDYIFVRNLKCNNIFFN